MIGFCDVGLLCVCLFCFWVIFSFWVMCLFCFLGYIYVFFFLHCYFSMLSLVLSYMCLV